MTNTKINEEIFSTLVKIADELDRENKLDLAEAVDESLKSVAADKKSDITVPIEDFASIVGAQECANFLMEATENMKVRVVEDGILCTPISHERFFAPASKFPTLQDQLINEPGDRLMSTAARPKAPLKSLDPEVKKSLLAFLYNANKNINESVNGLNEFFRRLRYFDVADIISEMDLDKVHKDMVFVQKDINESVKKFFEVTHGKRPNKNEIDTMMADDKPAAQKPQEFFEAQTKKPELEKPVEVEEKEHCEQCADDCNGCECHADDGISDDELEAFWK